MDSSTKEYESGDRNDIETDCVQMTEGNLGFELVLPLIRYI